MPLSQLQSSSDTAYDITLTQAVVDLNTIASTTILSVTEAGRLGSIGIVVTNAIGDACTVTLDITVDGGTKRTMTLYNAQTAWGQGSLLPWSSDEDQSGNLIDNHLAIPFNMNYALSLLVEIDVTEAAAASDEITVMVIKGAAL